MGANIVIRREKLQFMNNFNRFVAFILFFTQLKFGSISQVEMQNRFFSSSQISSLLPILVLDTYIMFLLFSCLYPEIIIQSNYCCTLTLVIVRFIWFAKC